jgi:predicted nicotinamide N-methyase
VAVPAGQTDPDLLRTRLAATNPPLLPELAILRATPASNVGSLASPGLAPYWAYAWPGGCLLARYLLDHPDTIKGRRAVDLGTGCGVVAIAAARAGATVCAVDLDPMACAATRLNADANGVAFEIRMADAFRDEVPRADVLLAGDLFYDRAVARQAARFLGGRFAEGAEILVGDIGRRYLPRERLYKLAAYDLPDFGMVREQNGCVYRWIA